MTSKDAIDRYMQKKMLIRKELIDELNNILVGIGMDGIIKRNWDGKLGKIKVADYASTKTPEYRFYTFKRPGVLLKLQSGRIPQNNAEEYILKNFSACDAQNLEAEDSAKNILINALGNSKEYEHALNYALECIYKVESETKESKDGDNGTV